MSLIGQILRLSDCFLGAEHNRITQSSLIKTDTCMFSVRLDAPKVAPIPMSCPISGPLACI